MGLASIGARLFGRGRSVLKEDMRSARPLRSTAATETCGEEGSLTLEVPLETQGRGIMAAIVRRMNAQATKKFELEEVGAFVWSLCDGQHTFEGIARKLRERFKMNRLEAEAALAEFLRILGRRKLITMVAGKKEGRKKR